MVKFFKNMRQNLIREIADAVEARLAPASWEKFLPPVTMNGAIYIATENGSIYRMEMDHAAQFERIVQIRRA